MEKKLQDYIQYYIHCDFYLIKRDIKTKITNYWPSQNEDEDFCVGYGLDNVNGVEDIRYMKPILRKLEDITEDEAKEMQNELLPGRGQKYPAHWHQDEMLSFITGNMRPTLTPAGVFNCTHYLLTKHFDLFNLIESGLAIDASTLTK